MNRQTRSGLRGCLLILLCSMVVGCACVDRQLTAGTSERGLSPEKLGALTSFMQSKIDAGHLPGTVMVVAHKGRVVYAKALGALDPRTGAPMREDAIFRLHSMTKPVVSVAALLLLEEGKLQLNDPVSKYIPELTDLRVRVEATSPDGTPTLVAVNRPITLLDLMRHTAGMIYDSADGTPLARQYHAAFAAVTSSDDFIRKLAALPLDHQPSTQWSYSVSHDVLGVVIERVSGKPLPVFLEERIFAPLKMVDTAFWVEPSRQHRIAQPFAADPDSKQPIIVTDPTKMSLMAAGGGSGRIGNGMMSTARDYLRFIEMLRNGGQLDGVRILSRKSAELVGSDHIKGMTGGPTPGHGWGLGVTVRNEIGGAIYHGSIGEYGWGGGAGTSFFIDPTEQLTAVRLAQAPASRRYYNVAFRNFIYSALE